jgi:uncharacterized membrane protein
MATSTPGGAQTNLGLEPNVAGLLCYVPCCIGLVFSVVAAIVEKQSRFVRFHAFQGLLLNGIVLVALVGLGAAQTALAIVGLGAVAALLHLLLWVTMVAAAAIMILLMIRANGGEELELPVIGALARGWV